MKEIISKYFRAKFEEEESSGFAFLRKIPSIEVKRFLLAYAELDVRQRELYKVAMASHAGRSFGHIYDWNEKTESSIVFDRLHRLAPYPPGLVERRPDLVKARDLRSLSKIAFGQLLGAKPVKSEEPGDWIYDGYIGSNFVSVCIRYSLRMTQMEYTLNVGSYQSWMERFSYERLYGLGIGCWDMIYSSEIDQAFAVFKDVVSRAVEDYGKVRELLDAKPV